MRSLQRSCQTALNLRQSFSPVSNGSRRAFSRTGAVQRGALPQFLESSSPELSNYLSLLNSKILLPQHLTPEQQRLVYQQKNRARLEAESIEITLGQVTLPLEYIDRNRDLPNQWQTLKSILKHTKTPEDWENVVRMLEGFKSAGLELQPARRAMIVRKLGAAGQQHLILKMLQRAESTGIRLGDERILIPVLLGIRLKASRAKPSWDATETKKALSFSEQIMELMENPDHFGGMPVVRGDPRASPFVIASPLELAAVRAKKHTGGQDVDGKVKKYATRLMQVVKQDQLSENDLPRKLLKFRAPLEVPQTLHDILKLSLSIKGSMATLIVFWNAVKTARQVLGADMPMADEAQKLESDLRSALATGQKTVESLNKDMGKQDDLGVLAEDIKICEQL